MIQSERTVGASPTFIERHARVIFLFVLFCVLFVLLRAAIRPINDTDYQITVKALQAFVSGQDPYAVQGFFMPPWSLVLLLPLSAQPIETWLALVVALFATLIMDIGRPYALLLFIHPVFITLLATANPEGILTTAGLWLIYRAPHGWTRGLAWLLLTCKPQTAWLFLLMDGFYALRERDWRAIMLAVPGAVVLLLMYPQFFEPLSVNFGWSATVIHHYGVLGAVAATALILLVRGSRIRDHRTTALILTPIWSPFMLQYSFTASTLFTLRRTNFLGVVVCTVGSIALAWMFWQDFHRFEQIGAFGMLLLSALFAPDYTSTVSSSAAGEMPQSDVQTPAQSA